MAFKMKGFSGFKKETNLPEEEEQRKIDAEKIKQDNQDDDGDGVINSQDSDYKGRGKITRDEQGRTIWTPNK